MHKEINILTASALRGLRAENKMSLEDVANVTGINKDTIHRYENSSVSMQLWILDKLVDSYGLTLDIFFKTIYDKMQNKSIRADKIVKEK